MITLSFIGLFVICFACALLGGVIGAAIWVAFIYFLSGD